MSKAIGIDCRKVSDFGIGTYIRNLVRALAELDQTNRYFLFVGPDEREALDGLPSNFALVEETAALYGLREQVSLSWRIARLRLDLYHATHYVLPAFVTSRVVVTIHDIIHLLFPEFLPSRLAFFYAHRMIRRSLARGDRVITGSNSSRSDLMRYFDVDGKKIDVIYHGVEPLFHEPLPADELARRRDRLGLDRPYLLFVGNPKPHKNLDHVIKAYARSLELHRYDASLVCVGSRPKADFKIRQRAAQLGVADRVKLLGHVDHEELPAIYQGATLFLYPTLYEGFGLPVIEAMASGVPVITSDTSALEEIGRGYAHLVNPLDVEGTAAAIAHCMTDPDHRRSLTELGRKRAREFRWERAAAGTLEVYQQVLRGEPS